MRVRTLRRRNRLYVDVGDLLKFLRHQRVAWTNLDKKTRFFGVEGQDGNLETYFVKLGILKGHTAEIEDLIEVLETLQ